MHVGRPVGEHPGDGVADRSSLTKRIAHPTAGPLEFGIEALTAAHDPEQRLVVYTVEPHSATARVLPLLAAWAVAGPDAAVAAGPRADADVAGADAGRSGHPAE